MGIREKNVISRIRINSCVFQNAAVYRDSRNSLRWHRPRARPRARLASPGQHHAAVGMLLEPTLRASPKHATPRANRSNSLWNTQGGCQRSSKKSYLQENPAAKNTKQFARGRRALVGGTSKKSPTNQQFRKRNARARGPLSQR